MSNKTRYYRNDIALLKSYNDQRYKLTLCRCLRSAGYEFDDNRRYSDKGTVNDEKLSNNISRARAKIFEYAICNDWQVFATFTIDPKKYDRNDLEKYHKAFAQFIRNYNRINSTNIKYLLIPEKHKKGGWHEHGLISGLDEKSMRLFTLEEKLPTYIRKKLKEGDLIYEWIQYRRSFGFCDLEPIKNHEAVSKYITKYITEALTQSITDINAHLYYCSHGLRTAETIKKGLMLCDIKPDYENEYVKVQWFSKEQKTLALQMID